jgi:hypothetical protein
MKFRNHGKKSSFIFCTSNQNNKKTLLPNSTLSSFLASALIKRSEKYKYDITHTYLRDSLVLRCNPHLSKILSGIKPFWKKSSRLVIATKRDLKLAIPALSVYQLTEARRKAFWACWVVLEVYYGLLCWNISIGWRAYPDYWTNNILLLGVLVLLFLLLLPFFY